MHAQFSKSCTVRQATMLQVLPGKVAMYNIVCTIGVHIISLVWPDDFFFCVDQGFPYPDTKRRKSGLRLTHYIVALTMMTGLPTCSCTM